ncbi:MAG: hypothetical protein FWG50_10490 [Kiritimatiellaeota bacterium]|nr:hypothetical protein [Kiritimatiellota bacterium]
MSKEQRNVAHGVPPCFRAARTRRVTLFVALFLTATARAQWPDWSVVPDATMRVDLRVNSEPPHPDLGVIAMIPDGGLLPAKNPTPDVRDSEGKPVEHLIFGHNPKDVMGIVFAPQKSGSGVSVFFKPGNNPPPKPNTRLFPSVVYFTKNGNGSMETARKFQNTYPPATGAFFGLWPCIGSMINPWGANDDFSSWYIGGFISPKSEKIFFATVSNAGSEFSVDGKKVHEWNGQGGRGSAAKGQQGKWLDLDAGVHRIDYFHYSAKGRGTEAQIVWKRDGVQLVNTNGYPELMQDFDRSGSSSIAGIRFRDGRTSAVVKGHERPVGYLWTGDNPVVLFSLNYVTSAAPADKAAYTWEFAKNKRLAEPVVDWLVTGDVANTFAVPVTLVASNASGVVRSTHRMISQYTPAQCSLDNPSDRQAFRKALNNMLRAVPVGMDPCVDWIPDYWQLLTDVIEPYRSSAMLNPIFTRALDGSLQKIAPRLRWEMEDRFIETIRLKRDDKLLLEWIDKLEKSEKTGARRFRWKDERFCAYLLDVNDLAAAKHYLSFLKEAAATPDQTQIASLRQGDYAFFTGEMDDATKFYKEAQDRYPNRAKVALPGGYVPYLDPSRRKAPTNTTSTVAAKANQSLAAKMASRIDAWKVLTVQDSSMYTTIVTFLAQDALEEALQKLWEWEAMSPLSKMTGEYTVAAARVYMYVEDYRRAINMLRNYRQQTTMNAMLADAMKLEMDCLLKLDDKDKPRIKELAEDFVKRFPGHPYEQQMNWILR